MKKSSRKKNQDKDYVPFWWIVLIFIVSIGTGGYWIDEDGAFARYIEQRRARKQAKKLARKAKKQNNHD